MGNIVEIIKDFEQKVHFANKVLEGLVNRPNLPLVVAWKKGIIPREGNIETDKNAFYYCFHGLGCDFSFEGKVIQIEYKGDNNNFKYHGFTFWGIYQYYLTSIEGAKITKGEFYIEMNKLKDLGVIIECFEYPNVYQLKK